MAHAPAIEGLDAALDGVAEGGARALEEAIAAITGGPARLAAFERFGARVKRLHLATAGARRSLMLKELEPAIAQRTRRLAEHWLPATGLDALGPGLLASAADADASRIWQIYEDFGDHGLERAEDDEESVRAAVHAIAEVHTRFADHALLGECRLWGGDLGMPFYLANARDGLRALEAVAAPAMELPPRGATACARLRTLLETLLDEADERGRALEELGGPETLVHGDLWTKNVFVIGAPGKRRVRLIDWDHVAVARFSYDLSTFLIRFPAARRVEILSWYRDAVEPAGWEIPGVEDLNGLFDTAERTRIANRVIWPALTLLGGEEPARAWAIDALAEVADWFDALEPVLPAGRSAVVRGSR